MTQKCIHVQKITEIDKIIETKKIKVYFLFAREKSNKWN